MQSRKDTVMAWFAELKRRRWYCILCFDAIGWYKGVLYEALSHEQRKAILLERKRIEEENRKKARESCLALTVAMSIALRSC